MKLWMLFALGAVAAWGCYVPVLHEGQAALKGGALRAFLCVGVAYTAIRRFVVKAEAYGVMSKSTVTVPGVNCGSVSYARAMSPCALLKKSSGSAGFQTGMMPPLLETSHRPEFTSGKGRTTTSACPLSRDS